MGEPTDRTRRLKDRLGHSQIRALLLLDRDGRVVLSTDERSEIGADFSGRTYSRSSATAGSRALRDEPFLARVTSAGSSRSPSRSRDRAGRFAGVPRRDHGHRVLSTRCTARSILGEAGFVSLAPARHARHSRPPREVVLQALPDRDGGVRASPEGRLLRLGFQHDLGRGCRGS